MAAGYDLELVPHPAAGASAGAVRAVHVHVERAGDAGLALRFAVTGDMGRLRIPAVAPPRLRHGLWQGTCCEIFIARDSDVLAEDRRAFAYRELNLSPSGEWAGYAFASYRENVGTVDEALAPRISVRRAAGRLDLCAEISRDLLGPDLADAPLRLGVSAVIEDESGALSYWALRHPPGNPDFHHADAFALRLEALGDQC